MLLLKKTLGLVKTKEFRVMNTLGERISWVLKQKGLERKQLAKLLGVTTMAIGDIVNNKTQKPRNLLDIAEILDVDPKWLKDGIGELPQISTEISPMQNETNDSVVIKVLDIHASAGFGAVNGDVVQVIKELRFVPEEYHRRFPGINESITRVINVKGDSMNPTFQHGDLLFVDISISTFDGDGIYVFTFDNNLFVKRVQKTGRDFCIISDNETAYKSWNITPEDMPDMIFHGKVRVHQSQQLNFLG